MYRTKKPRTNIFFFDTDVILHSSEDSSDKINPATASPLSGTNSKFIDTGRTLQTSSKSEKFNS